MSSELGLMKTINMGTTQYRIETHISCTRPLQYSIRILAGLSQQPLGELQRLCIDGYIAKAFSYNEDLLEQFLDTMVNIIKAAPPAMAHSSDE